MRPEAREAWLEASERIGNPSSLHSSGRAARGLLEDARDRIAAALGAHPTEVILTAGATEALNTAIKGYVWAAREAGLPDGVVTGEVEHHAVLDACGWLEATGSRRAALAVDADARYQVPAADAAVWDGAAVAALQWVNNETGAIQPLEEIAALAAARSVPVVGDIVQGIGQLDFSFAVSGLTAAAVSAHKLGGPVGVGALLLRRAARVVPLLHGGGQERRLRSGTLDVAGACAFAAALDATVASRQDQAMRHAAWAARIGDAIRQAAPDATVHAPSPAGGMGSAGPGAGVTQAPHIVHAVIPGAPSEALLLALDRAGMDASPGAACTAGVIEASHVVTAMGFSEADAASTVRLSLGWNTTEGDVDAACAALPPAISIARGLR